MTRCKLYKDAEGENKGDGIVTFASEEGLEAALARDDWNLFGDMLSVSRPTFTTKEAVPTARRAAAATATVRGRVRGTLALSLPLSPNQVPKEDWGRIVALKHM